MCRESSVWPMLARTRTVRSSSSALRRHRGWMAGMWSLGRCGVPMFACPHIHYALQPKLLTFAAGHVCGLPRLVALHRISPSMIPVTSRVWRSRSDEMSVVNHLSLQRGCKCGGARVVTSAASTFAHTRFCVCIRFLHVITQNRQWQRLNTSCDLCSCS